jgi:iron-sulfur cluster assembly protein
LENIAYGYRIVARRGGRNQALHEQHGVAVITKKKMALHLDGTKIDFQDGPMGRGFTIENPNVAKSGGCGSCGCH